MGFLWDFELESLSTYPHFLVTILLGVLWFWNDVCMNGLRELRLGLGLSQVEVARWAEIPLPTYKRIERGEGRLTMKVVGNVAKALEAEANTIYEALVSNSI